MLQSHGFSLHKSLVLLAFMTTGFYLLKIPALTPLIDWHSHHLAKLLWQSTQLISDNFQLQGQIVRLGQSGLGVTVANTCNGFDFVLAASAFVVICKSPMPQKILGILLTIFLVQGFNFIRVMLMLFANVSWHEYFNFAHEYMASFLLTLCTGLWLYYWHIKTQTNLSMASAYAD